MASREARDLIPLVVEQCVTPNDERVDAQPGKLGKRGVNFTLGARIDNFDSHSRRCGRSPNLGLDLFCNRELRIYEQSDDPRSCGRI
jgi:hypothetical protein